MGVAILPHRVLQTGTPLPEYTYTGSHQLIDDGDGNWRIKFLTSGTLTFSKKPKNIDVFLVGGGASGGSSFAIDEQNYDYEETGNSTTLGIGGGAGGGGGYTQTQRNISVSSGTEYSIVVGAGGATVKRQNGTYYPWGSDGKRVQFVSGKAGGNTTAFGYTANGGSPGHVEKDDYSYGGAGGSGGGGMQVPVSSSSTAGRYGQPMTGGSDGSDSTYTGSESTTSRPTTCAGQGQGTTTREFGESSGQLYAGGGGSGNAYYNGTGYDAAAPGGSGGGGAGGYKGTTSAQAGSANTGGGGGGSPVSSGSGEYASSGAGGSGIVIIRNAR